MGDDRVFSNYDGPHIPLHDPNALDHVGPSRMVMQPGPQGRETNRQFNAAVRLASDISYTALIVTLSRQMGRHPTDQEIVGFLEGNLEEKEAIWLGHDEALAQSMASHPAGKRRHLKPVPDICGDWVDEHSTMLCKRPKAHEGPHNPNG